MGGKEDFKMKRIFCGKKHWSEECRHNDANKMKGESGGERSCFICLSNKHLFQQANKTQQEEDMKVEEEIPSFIYNNQV